ncbi:MAG TPA: hypothetical protein VGN63_18355 [Flavisolibacter sp.]|jgi:uncharacterized membrane protein YjjP (DUF1212 family)|nr:hypothetical protein [Flavisolibacter sp.]
MAGIRPLVLLALAFASPFLLLLAAGGIQYVLQGRFLSVDAMLATKGFRQF